jgi:CHAT domain-containing protein
VGTSGDKVAYVLNNMGIIREKQGRHEEAIRLNMKALAIYSLYNDMTLAPTRWALQSLAHSYRATNQPDTAILFAKMAVNTQQRIRSRNMGLEEAQAASLRDHWRGIYQDLADMLIEKGRIAEAQRVLDLLKQQELIEFVRRDASGGGIQETATLTSREKATSGKIEEALESPLALAAELAELSAKRNARVLTSEELQRLGDLEAELDKSFEVFVTDVEVLLSAVSEESSAAQSEITELNLEYAADRQEMLRDLPRTTVLLQAVSLGKALHVFLTTKDVSIHREVKIERADLAQQVFRTLTAIEGRSSDTDVYLAELYKLLIKPVESDLVHGKAEVIMLNLGGFLRYLPFAALKSGHGYLIEDYALAVDTPAAQTKFESVDRKGVVAAGFGVTAKHEGFSPLPGVEKELEAIFEGHDKKGELPGLPLLDTAFTEDSFKEALKERPQLLHVASHFKFVPGNETDSFLLLGDGDALSLEEIRKTRGLRFGGVDLLTLSACETAKGGDAEGDEVESFGAIAQMNGASAVMATLWPIADEPSGRLMADFYAGLIEDGLDKASSLRRAQIAMLRGVPSRDVALQKRGASDAEAASEPQTESGADHAAGAVSTRHPYYWSAYILMGNWL